MGTKRIKKKMSIPIIFLTSKDEEVDELLGLKLGADDFIKKSGGFSIKVLIERIRVQLRKKSNPIGDIKSLITHGKLKLDPNQLECEWNGKALPEKLTTTEFLIVRELAKRPGVIKERAHLMDIAYKENTDIEDRTIDSHIKRIRKKFRKVDEKFSSIETYNDLLDEQEKELEDNPSYKIKSNIEIELEARESTLKTLNEMYDFYEDITRSDWFSFYINSFVEQYDPHTIYYSPDAKDRFDVDMSGNYAGIGARLSKKFDKIEVVEIISGGPAWRQNLLEVGDIILKVRQDDQDKSESTSILGMPISDAVKLIKGPKGTNVILTIKKVDGEVLDLKIERDIVLLEETYPNLNFESI